MMKTLPKVVVLSTGGTIVSSGTCSTQLTGYSITNFTVDQLLSCVPELNDIARIETLSVSNIDSSSMTSLIWEQLVQAVTHAATDPDVAGIVVTHGTDTMDETAFFLNLVLKTEKPVILTGAMRPATAISADGPINLLNAVRVAAHPESRGKGVLIVLNDKILSARDAIKTDPTNASTFASPEFGTMGLIAGEDISFFHLPYRRHTTKSQFNCPALPLPRVDIIFSHVDDDDVMVRAALLAHASGIVHVGTGNGSIHCHTEQALIEAARNGVLVVRASRTYRGNVVNGLQRWQEASIIPAGTLPAQKARILLQLALAHGMDAHSTLQAFHEY